MSDGQQTTPATKAAVLAQIQQERAALEETVAQLSPAQLSRPGPEGWSPKDHLTHVVIWEQMLIGRNLEGRSFADVAGVDEATGESLWQMSEDEVNAYFQARDRGLSSEEALAGFQQSYQQVLAALAEVDEAKLFAPYREDSPLLVEIVLGNTAEHYRDHNGWIRALAGFAA
jgi:hypothetical protein